MKFHHHFWERRRLQEDRQLIPVERVEAIVANPLREEVQDNGRIRRWGVAPELGGRFVRVVLFPDGETVLTAFIDGKFRP